MADTPGHPYIFGPYSLAFGGCHQCGEPRALHATELVYRAAGEPDVVPVE